MNNYAKGIAGEQAAVRYIQDSGGVIIAQNYNAKVGEIDIIFADGDVIVFCEVKSRAHTRYGTPSEAVGYNKRLKISRAATVFIRQNNCADKKMRFDVIEIMGDNINHIKNAFMSLADW